MTKNEAIQTAAYFLATVYGNSRRGDPNAVGAIMKAEADGNTETLCNALGGVRDFCADLIGDLKGEKQNNNVKIEQSYGKKKKK